jgi:phosphatidylethanolamine/phosphatidyl-N-methylethanolamine N-methyltransferase
MVREPPLLVGAMRRPASKVHRRARRPGRREPDLALFFGRWLRAPHRIGAVAPASRFLARAMAEQVELRDGHPVVELGGGTGSVTRALLEVGVPPERLIVVEHDERLFRLLRHRFPQLRVLHGDAGHLVALLRPLGIEAVSTVISSLPLVAMPKRLRRQIVDQSFALLGEAGRFIQYTYALTSPLARRELGLKGRIAARIWFNVPPAAVWSYGRASAAA